MIEQINSYAITSGQPGIINEEAFTTLELVGKCAQKVNECIDQVNENTDDVTTMQVQYSAVRELAQSAVRTANEAQSDSNEAMEYSLAAMRFAEQAKNSANSVEQRYTENLEEFFSLWTDEIYNVQRHVFYPAFTNNIAQLIANVLNHNSKYYNFTTGDPFGTGVNLKCFDVTLYDTQNLFAESGLFGFGKLKFTIIDTIPGLEIQQTDNAVVVVWEYSQMVYGSPNLDEIGQFRTAIANGVFTIPIAEYSTTHQYDGNTFNKMCFGTNVDRTEDVHSVH